MQAGLPLHLPRAFHWPQPSASSRRLSRGLLACLLLLMLGLVSPLRLGIVSGSSMTPTYRSGQPFLMSRAHVSTPRLGAVVVFEHGPDLYIKRVVATEGQEVWGMSWSESGGRPDLLLDRRQVARMERLVKRHPQLGQVIHLTVPGGCVFVVGDGVSSRDSRHFGPVPVSSIRGIVVVPARAPSIASLHRPPARTA